MNFVFIPLERDSSSQDIVSSSSNPSSTGMLPLSVAASVWRSGSVKGLWMLPIAVLALSSGGYTSSGIVDDVGLVYCKCPYSPVEKRARQVYAGLHHDKVVGNSFPVMLPTTKAGMDSACRLFKKRDVGSITETLDVLERLLADR